MSELEPKFFGRILQKDPLIGNYHLNLTAKSYVLLYHNGDDWCAQLMLNGQDVLPCKAKTPSRALRQLERRVERMVKMFAVMIAKHFTELGRKFRAIGSRIGR